METVIKNHYLHRKCSCEQAFGLFAGQLLVGCIIYGTPSSAALRAGICGPEYKNEVTELARLWVDDACPKNSESYLIGNTLPAVKKPIIVSYADPSQGHVGYVYQATNWIYTGLSAKRTNWFFKGATQHNQTLTDKYSSRELREKYGDDFVLVPRQQKHRYIFFNKARRKELLSKLRYAIMAYPKKGE